jgi:hypothetical protein
MPAFDYHAWASRHSSGKKRVFTIREHVMYMGVSVVGIAGCVAAMVWAVSVMARIAFM